MQGRSMSILIVLLGILSYAQSRLAGECAMICNDLRFEVLTLEMCRDAKRTLPKPKVGDFCSNAMEQGFSDACVALCMEQVPMARVAQTCRAAAIEMPRPTVRRWCEHGYNVAFQKTVKDLGFHFRPEPEVQEAEPVVEIKQPEPVINEETTTTETNEVIKEIKHETDHVESGSLLRGGAKTEHANNSENRNVLATIPVTLDDTTTNLIVYEGQNAEEAVVIFCREKVPSDVSNCIRQLLSVVLEKLEEGAASKA